MQTPFHPSKTLSLDRVPRNAACRTLALVRSDLFQKVRRMGEGVNIASMPRCSVKDVVLHAYLHAGAFGTLQFNACIAGGRLDLAYAQNGDNCSNGS
jgi:hypothetical protein